MTVNLGLFTEIGPRIGSHAATIKRCELSNTDIARYRMPSLYHAQSIEYDGEWRIIFLTTERKWDFHAVS